MNSTRNFVVTYLVFIAVTAVTLYAQEKVQLEEPKQPDLVAELQEAPDGVLRVKTKEDGSFQSLVVKASVEIEDVLGGQKGKQLARKEAEIECKRHLSKWLNENCVFVEGANKTVTIQTKGESAKDAAGNTVKLRSQQGEETKVFSETSASVSQAALKGLNVVTSDVLDGGKEFVLVMSLTQRSLAQSAAVGNALSGRSTGGSTDARGAKAGADEAAAKESKVNRDALDDLQKRP